ncbi:unnamed protein product [Lactuca virosa]|uniref:RNase III domain-containing protein n=1 Tax=Lactuca virosa TaxID=75947 RepID=A0AAU9NB70_9ASTR|nr:unnamed protein product [Lactuca virosa]
MFLNYQLSILESCFLALQKQAVQESWMIALDLKKMHLCHSMPNADVHEFDQLSLKSTFGWESETSFPKLSVLGDVIESLAGAILVDSGYDKDRALQTKRTKTENGRISFTIEVVKDDIVLKRFSCLRIAVKVWAVLKHGFVAKGIMWKQKKHNNKK